MRLAGLPLCDSESCYLCKTLTSKQITDRKGIFKYYSNKFEKGMTGRTNMKQPGYVNDQLEANLASRIKDYNPAWAEKKFGFCRPSCGIPLLVSIEEYVKLDPERRVEERNSQLGMFIREYNIVA